MNSQRSECCASLTLDALTVISEAINRPRYRMLKTYLPRAKMGARILSFEVLWGYTTWEKHRELSA
jgi:hypothetical protein